MNKIIILFCLTVALCTSCSKFLEVTPKATKVVYSVQEVRSALTSYLFALITNYGDEGSTPASYVRFNGMNIYYPMHRNADVGFSLYSDNLSLPTFISGTSTASGATNTNGGYPYRTYYYENQKWESIIMSERLWRQLYANIGYLNTLLMDLEKTPDKTISSYEIIAGEAKTLRAYYFFKLLQWFAPLNEDIGIPMNIDPEVYEGIGRSSQKKVYKFIIDELTEVLSYKTAPETGYSLFYNEGKLIINAILAEIFIYKGTSVASEATDWINAEKFAKAVIDLRSIETTTEQYQELFLTTSRQVIRNSPFALLQIQKWGNMLGSNYAPWGTTGAERQYADDKLVRLFSETDIRFQYFFRKEASSGKYLCTKHKWGNGSVDNNLVLFRVSGVYINYIEALARQGKSEAITELNKFRKLKDPLYKGYNGNDVTGEVIDERRKEMCFEWDYRWIDMKRTKMTITREAMTEDGLNVTHTLASDDFRYTLPIPAFELENNNNLTQNPGWTSIF